MGTYAERPTSAAGRDSPLRTTADAAAARGSNLDRVTLRFADDRLETAFRAELFRNVIVSVRAAHVLGIAAWVIWWLIIGQYAVEAADVDVLLRFGVLIPILILGLLVTMLPFAPLVWEAEVVFVNLLAALVWTIEVTGMAGLPFDLSYIGVIFILAFSFTLNRLRFVPMALAGLAMIGVYFVTIVAFGRAEDRQLLLAFFSLGSFYVLGMIASYTLERYSRLLFLRERQLDHEHRRSEALLLNILPRPIAERLMDRADVGASRPDDPALADGFAEVAVLFADLVGFTEHAGRTPPDVLVATLNDLFSEMDTLADRYGLEKIKTVGDAYMAVAGVPTEVGDPAHRAMGMALDLVAAVEGRRWPSGDPVEVRVGIALGPAVAGVIGRRKFAYDVWGDTVNIASRLQTAGPPGCVLVAEAAVERAGDRFIFGPLEYLDLKGKGSQALRVLVGRAGQVSAVTEDVVSP